MREWWSFENSYLDSGSGVVAGGPAGLNLIASPAAMSSLSRPE